ncbi:hypothetical protein E1B28_009529 [Marasmius oreades]|uniref:Uncharacterized protein n=1 Tax=Marasmius oreades TaxID=181124 RepID=A0A9P7USQ6_9AGAR|nr:uncharacterized protein E1B28_009529 [Marasmius oreades]KAG7090409.1 hypothetical protein E1B28_009529 [Marasmius oreades]
MRGKRSETSILTLQGDESEERCENLVEILLHFCQVYNETNQHQPQLSLKLWKMCRRSNIFAPQRQKPRIMATANFRTSPCSQCSLRTYSEMPSVFSTPIVMVHASKCTIKLPTYETSRHQRQSRNL